MTEFMNNVNNKQSSFSTMSSFYAPKINSNQATPTTQAQKPDTVDLNNKESINKDKKKKIITYSEIAAGIGLAILTFFKRKQIGDFFSGLFKKKPKNPPVQPDTPRSPRGTDVPPVPPSGGNPSSPPLKGTDLGGNTPPSTNGTTSEVTKISSVKIEQPSAESANLIKKYYEACLKYQELRVDDPLRKTVDLELRKMENQLRKIKDISWKERPD